MGQANKINNKRKEILGILALFILTSSIKSKNYNLSLYASSIIYTIGIFSHSVNLFFLSTILFILYNFQKTKKYYNVIIQDSEKRIS